MEGWKKALLVAGAAGPAMPLLVELSTAVTPRVLSTPKMFLSGR